MIPADNESVSAIYRPAALFLTNKENFTAEKGDYAGTQINSGNMLWSLSGNLAIVHKVFFGIEFKTGSLVFHPFVPKAFSGKRTLTNFRYRDAILNITVEGYGNKIRVFEFDGKVTESKVIPSTLSGTHTVRIILADNQSESSIRKVPDYTTTETPVAEYSDGTITWNAIPGATVYSIIKNGIPFRQTGQTSFRVNPSTLEEYQIIAVDKNNVSSFASEPVQVVNGKYSREIGMEDFAPVSDRKYLNYQGKGFVEVSKTENKTIHIPVRIDRKGMYAISFRYSNGNGPINTQNKCAIRTLKIDNEFSGTIVLPQRGTDEWSNWGNSNIIRVEIQKGNHLFSVSFEPENENMNGEINQAMFDTMIINNLY